MKQALPASGHVIAPNSILIGPTDKNTIITTTWVFDRSLSAENMSIAITNATNFCIQSGLTLLPSRPHHLKISGTVDLITTAFGITLNDYKKDNITYHTSTDKILLPSDLVGPVVAILGLDNYPKYRPHAKAKAMGTNQPFAVGSTNFVTTVAGWYNFPSGNGTGQTIGIIELGNSVSDSTAAQFGYSAADMTAYWSALYPSNVPPLPTIHNYSVPDVVTVGNHGSLSYATSGNPSDSQVEVTLDIQLIIALLPEATINVFMANNDDSNFYEAIYLAVEGDSSNVPPIPASTIVSISWGGPETEDLSFITSLNTLLAAHSTVTVCVSSGDSGSAGDPSAPTTYSVEFPASSPYVLSCGGTTVTQSSPVVETVWNNTASSGGGASGGGYSMVNGKPIYQNYIGFPAAPSGYPGTGRGLPDVSGNADPNTGYYIIVAGTVYSGGGTSAVAPLWTGLTGRLNQNLGYNLGFYNSLLYSNTTTRGAFHNVTSGNNIPSGSGLSYFTASTGWNAATGLGSPNGTAILAALQALCVTEDTMILMADGTEKPISKVKRGDYVAADIYCRNKFRVATVLVEPHVCHAKADLMVFNENCLGSNVPNRKLIITAGHPIIYNGTRCVAGYYKNRLNVEYFNGRLDNLVTPNQNGLVYLYDLQFEDDGQYVANGLVVQSRCPWSEFTPLPKELYYNVEMYREERALDSFNHRLLLQV